MESRNCLNCNKRFFKSSFYFKNNKGSFCSHKCYWNSLINKNHSEESKRKMSIKMKEKYSNGYINPMKNKENKWGHQTEETKQKISKILKEKYKTGLMSISKETRKKISDGNKGIERTKEHKKILSELRKKDFRNKEYYNKIQKALKPYREFMKNRKPNEHPCWNGGTANEPYDFNFNKQFKSLIKLRDNYCCINCGISEQKHFLINGIKLCVHHINYIKKDSCLKNCITLCNRCNIKANSNREYWTNFFQSFLSEKYNYNYTNNQNIILNSKEMNL